MEKQQKTRRDFFSDLVKFYFLGAFLSRSAFSFNDLFALTGPGVQAPLDYPVCFSVRYQFTGNKSEQDIFNDLRLFGNPSKLKKIFTAFEKQGKISPIRHYQVANQQIEFKLYFRDLKSQKEYEKALVKHQVVNATEREGLGYQVATSLYKNNEFIA